MLKLFFIALVLSVNISLAQNDGRFLNLAAKGIDCRSPEATFRCDDESRIAQSYRRGRLAKDNVYPKPVEKEKEPNKDDDAIRHTQSDHINMLDRKIEVGLHFTQLQLGPFSALHTREWYEQILKVPTFEDTFPFYKISIDNGVGARFTYNLNKILAVEAEANWYFQKVIADRPRSDRSIYLGGQKWQMLFGPKIGYRAKKFGVFGKVRPGFIQFVEYPVVTEFEGSKTFFYAIQEFRRTTFFNIDVGGVFEYYPTKRTIVRFDMGDTIIRYNAKPREFNPIFTRHNLQMNIGFGFRF